MMFKRFAASEGGNFAAIFAIASIPIMTAVAGMVDFAETHRKTSQVQQALDATALAMANMEMKGTVPSPAEAEAYFHANLANWSGAFPSFSYVAPSDSVGFAALLEDLKARAILGQAAEGERIRGVTASFQHQGVTPFAVGMERDASCKRAHGCRPACMHSGA